MTGQGGSEASAEGGSHSTTVGRSIGESILPVYDEFRELIRKSYYTFEEQRALWAKAIRHQRTGQARVRIVNDPKLYSVDVQRHAPGYLAWDIEKVMQRCPQALEAVFALVERNCESEYFVSPQEIERETEERLARVMQPRIAVSAHGSIAGTLPTTTRETNPLL